MRRNKFYSILLSLAIAFGMWLYVVSFVTTDYEDTIYNIPVVMEGETVLNENNLMITSKSTSTISLHVTGKRSDISKLDNQNITVKVNLSNIREPGEHIKVTPSDISYPNGVAKNAVTVLSQSPIYVDIEEQRSKEVPVEILWEGSRSEGYLYDTENTVLDYPAVTVAGPASVADLIEKAVIEVDLTDQTESISADYRYTLVDKDGQPVDAEQITVNVEQVHMETKIHRIKEIRLVVQVIYGGGTTNETASVVVEPQVIRVSGSTAVLEELGDTLTLATVDLGSIETSADLTYPITLPEGVTNQTGITDADVSIRFSGLAAKEFTIGDIKAVNVPEGMEADIINANLTVKVRGAAAVISQLEAENISASVDLTNAVEGTSTYKAAILFGEGYEDLGAMGTYSVSVTIRKGKE